VVVEELSRRRDERKNFPVDGKFGTVQKKSVVGMAVGTSRDGRGHYGY
jgi:hypothetical protein